jgi:hypothetical protein
VLSVNAKAAPQIHAIWKTGRRKGLKKPAHQSIVPESLILHGNVCEMPDLTVRRMEGHGAATVPNRAWGKGLANCATASGGRHRVCKASMDSNRIPRDNQRRRRVDTDAAHRSLK